MNAKVNQPPYTPAQVLANLQIMASMTRPDKRISKADQEWIHWVSQSIRERGIE